MAWFRRTRKPAGRVRRPAQIARIHHPSHRVRTDIYGRLVFAGFSVLAVVAGGTFGYYAIGGGDWALLDCLYMVLVTVTTVGYSEVLPVHDVLGGRAFTIALLGFGVGVSIYFMSTLTAFIVEGDLGEAIWRRKMHRNLNRLDDHYIVCGAGVTGRSVIEELLEGGQTVVVIELDVDHLETLSRRVEQLESEGVLSDAEHRLIKLRGDATEDAVLLEAGLEHARGIVATLQNDRDNLFVTVTARQYDRQHGGQPLRIISRAFNELAGRKLLGAGADAVVSPNAIGGRRMAHELLRPTVVGFMEMIVRDREHNLGIEQIVIQPGSRLHGTTLATSGIRAATNALVLSLVDTEGGYQFNPLPEIELTAGMTLVVMGEHADIVRLVTYVNGD